MIRERARAAYTKEEIRGCIDLGSSNFRLLVVDGTFPALDREARDVFELRSLGEMKRYVGWGDDLARTGNVSPGMAARAAHALGELVAAARAWGCAHPLVVATNTLRESSNAGEVGPALEEACGVAIRVLSQREEAEFGYVGASFFFARDEALCLVDAGGTSTEISWGRGTSMEGYAGLPLGTHRVRLLLAGRGARRVSELLGERLGETGVFGSTRGTGVYPLPGFFRDSTMLMTGGTAVSLAVFHRYMRGCAPPFEELQQLTREDVALARRRLTGIRGAGRERRVPLDEGRMSLFPAGLVLIDALLAAARIEAFRVTARDLRWGIVLTGGESA
jgi:exopolyphosphatase/guanosine-5'-triphosphate,3'-diphosphate pyrophosphatase